VVDADTVKLVGYNTLNSPTYASGGTAASAIFTEFCELTGRSGQTGSTPVSDAATHCDTRPKNIYGRPEAGSLTLNYNMAPVAAQTALRDSYMNLNSIAYKIGFVKYPFVRIEIGKVIQMSDDLQDPRNGLWEGSVTIQREAFPENITPV
jgi:hypothetical protein